MITYLILYINYIQNSVTVYSLCSSRLDPQLNYRFLIHTVIENQVKN